jgi:hypothetical protein
MLMKTSGLTGAALDWAVALCEGATNLRRNTHRFDTSFLIDMPTGRLDHKAIIFLKTYKPSESWNEGGPINERERITTGPIWHDSKLYWEAYKESPDNENEYFEGETMLEAAMRCYVASKLGDEIEISEELL